jgi:hypothetical protein
MVKIINDAGTELYSFDINGILNQPEAVGFYLLDDRHKGEIQKLINAKGVQTYFVRLNPVEVATSTASPTTPAVKPDELPQNAPSGSKTVSEWNSLSSGEKLNYTGNYNSGLQEFEYYYPNQKISPQQQQYHSSSSNWGQYEGAGRKRKTRRRARKPKASRSSRK